MKRKYLLIVLTALTLAFSACGKEPADDVDATVVETSQSSEESKSEESSVEESTVVESSVEESSVEESTSVQAPVENEAMTLEKFYNQPLQKLNLDSTIKAQKQANAETLSDMGYEVHGNVFTNWYQYKDEVDVNFAVNYFNSYFNADLLNPLLDSIAQESGVEDVTVQYIYKDKDGNEIYNKCFVRGQVVDVAPIEETEEVEPTESDVDPDDMDISSILNAKTLEDIYGLPAMVETMNAQMEALKESYSNVYNDIVFEVKGNTVIYKYQYVTAVAADRIDSIAETLDASFSVSAPELIKSFKQEINADDIAVRYVFTDINDVVLFDKTYTE